jgi:hypothetical protein
MKDPNREERREDRAVSGTAAADVAERRAASRQHFVAEAQIVEISSGVRLSARSCDLGLNGCYVDTLIPFPVGTLVRIRLTKNKVSVEANGKVVNQSPGLGMGIAFHDVTPENQATLDKWFSQNRQRASLETLLPPVETELPVVVQRQPAPEFVELVQLLMKKAILTRTEAIGLLKKAIDE